MTLKLTQANLLRIRKTLIQFIQQDPLLSACVFVVVAAIITIIIVRYVKSAA